MLTTNTRNTLVNSLRPPPDYRVTDLIACTYTLDLRALLLPPLAFSLADHHADLRNGATPESVPLLLRSLRDHAANMLIFHQAGQVKAFSGEAKLLAYVEDSVVAVNAPLRDGIFHPKLWVLRLAPVETTENDAAPVRYRVLIPSRNITFDSSWDLVVCLEGEFKSKRSNSFSDSRTLADFVASLPELATRQLTASRQRQLARISDELRRVELELPDNCESLEFAVHGLGKPSPILKERADQMLVIAPFVDYALLASLYDGRQFPMTLLTREVALRKLGPAIFANQRDLVPWTLKDQAVPPEFAEESTEAERTTLHDLHAKAFIFDQGWDAKLWLGSANATNAAFQRNVEFMVGLLGKKKRLGVESWQNGLREITQSVELPTEPSERPDDSLAIERLLSRAGQALASLDWLCKCSKSNGPKDNELYEFDLSAQGSREAVDRVRSCLAALDGHAIAGRLRPISVGDTRWTQLELDQWPTSLSLGSFSTAALTSFFVLELSADNALSFKTVINSRLEGAPSDRKAQLLATLLSDRQTLLRFLRALLDFDSDALASLLSVAPNRQSSSSASTETDTPLLELMLRALASEPQRCRELVDLVKELDQTETGRVLVDDTLRKLCNQLDEALNVIMPTKERA